MQESEKNKFLKDLEELKNLDLLQYKDCNIMYNKFYEKYLQIIDKNIPYKILSKKEIKLKQKPWISRVMLTSIKIKHILYKNICKNKIFFGMKDINFIGIRSAS